MPLRQRVHDLRHRPPPPGVEGHFFTHVPPGLRAAQVPHQVHDAVQFVGLEGEDPLVVAERERRDRIGAHVGVLARHHAVLGQQTAALLVGQQVPLVPAHEGVDRDPRARLLAGQVGRDVALVELGGAVHRHVRPHRLTGPAEPGLAEARVRLLQGFGGLGVPPDHQVGVRAQAGDLVGAAHDDVLLGEVGVELVDLLREGAPAVLRQLLGHAEDGPRRVADHLVQLAGLAADRRGLGHDSSLPSSSPSCFTSVSTSEFIAPIAPNSTTALRADAMHAGMPTPSYAAPATAIPFGSAARTAATRSRCPTAYCGRASIQRCTCVSMGAAVMPIASVRSDSAVFTRSSSSRSRSFSSPCRPSEARRITRFPAACASHGHLAVEKVDALIARPSTGGTGNPEPGSPSGPMAAPGKAKVTMAIDAYSIAPSCSTAVVACSPSSRAASGPGTASTTASASKAVPSDSSSRHPSTVFVSALAPTPTRSSAPCRFASAPTAIGSRPTPPRIPAKTGPRDSLPDLAASRSRTPLVSDVPAMASGASCGTVAASESRSACPA